MGHSFPCDDSIYEAATHPTPSVCDWGATRRLVRDRPPRDALDVHETLEVDVDRINVDAFYGACGHAQYLLRPLVPQLFVTQQLG